MRERDPLEVVWRPRPILTTATLLLAVAALTGDGIPRVNVTRFRLDAAKVDGQNIEILSIR